MAGLLFVGTDASLTFRDKHQLEQAAKRGIELAVAPGTIAKGSFSYLGPEVRTANTKQLQYPKANVLLECNGARQSYWNSLYPAGQTFARFVSVRLQTDYVPQQSFDGILSLDGQNRGYVPTGGAAVRLQ